MFNLYSTLIENGSCSQISKIRLHSHVHKVYLLKLLDRLLVEYRNNPTFVRSFYVNETTRCAIFIDSIIILTIERI